MNNLIVILGASSSIGLNLLEKIFKYKNTFFILHVNENKKKN